MAKKSGGEMLERKGIRSAEGSAIQYQNNQRAIVLCAVAVASVCNGILSVRERRLVRQVGVLSACANAWRNWCRSSGKAQAAQ